MEICLVKIKNIYLKSGVATVACIVYGTGRGVKPDGTISTYPINYQFDTYKNKDGRKIFLKSVIGKNGENIAQHSFKWVTGVDAKMKDNSNNASETLTRYELAVTLNKVYKAIFN